MQNVILGDDLAQFLVFDACLLGDGATMNVVWEDTPADPSTAPCLGISGDLVYDRVYTVMDPCGNTATATQKVVLVDSQAPVWANPSESLDPLECTQDLVDLMSDPTFMLNEGGASDETNGEVTYSVEAVMLGASCSGTWYRQWTATDACGNVSYAEQFIPVVDETAPEFAFFPGDATVELDANGERRRLAAGRRWIPCGCGQLPHVCVRLDALLRGQRRHLALRRGGRRLLPNRTHLECG